MQKVTSSIGGVSRRWIPRAAGRIFMLDQLPSHQKSWYCNSPNIPNKIPKRWTNEIDEEARKMFRKGCQMWDGLMRLDMTDNWRKALSQNPAQTWLSIIAKGIPAPVKQLLSSDEPPTVAKLEALPWIETQNAGVYGWLLKPRRKLYLEKHCLLYVGSGSKNGIEGRKQNHLSKNWNEHNRRICGIIKYRKLGREGQFITLMMVEMKGAEREDTIAVRFVVTLAEALLTAWLGAIHERPRYAGDSSHLCPWGESWIPYSGLSTHNPLTKDIQIPIPSQASIPGDENEVSPASTIPQLTPMVTAYVNGYRLEMTESFCHFLEQTRPDHERTRLILRTPRSWFSRSY
jgi:hypothetical protein